MLNAMMWHICHCDDQCSSYRDRQSANVSSGSRLYIIILKYQLNSLASLFNTLRLRGLVTQKSVGLQEAYVSPMGMCDVIKNWLAGYRCDPSSGNLSSCGSLPSSCPVSRFGGWSCLSRSGSCIVH